MFMGCCKLCEVLSKIDWLIKLKIEIVTLSKFGLIRREMWISRDKNFVDINYLTVKHDRIPICESPTYNIVRGVYFLLNYYFSIIDNYFKNELINEMEVYY